MSRHKSQKVNNIRQKSNELLEGYQNWRKILHILLGHFLLSIFFVIVEVIIIAIVEAAGWSIIRLGQWFLEGASLTSPPWLLLCAQASSTFSFLFSLFCAPLPLSLRSFLFFSFSVQRQTAPETRVTLTMMMAIERGKIQETVPPLVCSSFPTCVFLHTRLPSVDHSSTYPGTSACQQVVDDEDCKDEDKLWLQRCFCGFSLFILEGHLFVWTLRWICLPVNLLSFSDHKYTHSYFYEHKVHHPVLPCLCSILLTKKEDSVRESKSPQGQRGLCPMSVPLTTFLLRM